MPKNDDEESEKSFEENVESLTLFNSPLEKKKEKALSDKKRDVDLTFLWKLVFLRGIVIDFEI